LTDWATLAELSFTVFRCWVQSDMTAAMAFSSA